MSNIDRFTKKEFEEALPVHKETGEPLWMSLGLVAFGSDAEETYSIKVPETNKRIVIRSSVDESGLAAEAGADSIRLWLEYWYKNEWRPLKRHKTRWTTRIPGWDKRMTQKLRELWKLALEDENEQRIQRKNLMAKLEQLQEQEAFSSDPDLGSPEMIKEAQAKTKAFEKEISQEAADQDPDTVYCPKGHPMVIRSGRYGEFYGCTKYPNCKETLSLDLAQAQLDERKAKTSSEKPKEFVPSPYQVKIFEFIQAQIGTFPKKNAVVEAVAGSGKTTTIEKALSLLPKGDSVLFCAFNKHIQTELARRVKRQGLTNVQASTVHSIGFATLKENLPVNPQIDEGKLWGIVKEVLPEQEDYPLRQPLANLARYAKRTLVDYQNPVAVEEMATYYGIELNGDGALLIALLPRVMELCKTRLSVIDYDDMIWLPVVLNLRFRTFAWVFVDEAQDLSPVQLEIVMRSKAGTGVMIAVGDRHQSIYGFTGADCESIPNIIKRLDAELLPLSITYRCPKSVVEMAQTLVPQIEAAEWAEDGEVNHMPRFKLEGEVEDQDLVLCRINAPLVKTCYSLIRQGRKAVIRGRDIGKGLLNFIDRLHPLDIHDLLSKIREYRHEQTKKLEAAGKDAQIESLHDRCDTLTALCDGVYDLTELRANIKRIFNDKSKKGVILSSIHRAKGDEANRVFLLKPELLPHPLATKPWQQEQEKNLEYVAYTRAKQEFVFVEG